MKDLIASLNHAGPLSSKTIVSRGIKLLSIFITVLLKIQTFSLALVLRKDLLEIKSVIAHLQYLLVNSARFLVGMMVGNIFVN